MTFPGFPWPCEPCVLLFLYLDWRSMWPRANIGTRINIHLPAAMTASLRFEPRLHVTKERRRQKDEDWWIFPWLESRWVSTYLCSAPATPRWRTHTHTCIAATYKVHTHTHTQRHPFPARLESGLGSFSFQWVWVELLLKNSSQGEELVCVCVCVLLYGPTKGKSHSWATQRKTAWAFRRKASVMVPVRYPAAPGFVLNKERGDLTGNYISVMGVGLRGSGRISWDTKRSAATNLLGPQALVGLKLILLLPLGSIWRHSMFNVSKKIIDIINFALYFTTFPNLLGTTGKKHKIHMICFQCPVHNLYASVFFGVNL